MQKSSGLRRARLSQNLDKELLKKLYNQYNVTQHQLNKFNSVDHGYKDVIIKDQTFVSSNNQNYSPQEIYRAYKFLSNNSSEGLLNLNSLRGFLEEQGEGIYTGAQMISFLDKQKKGYVSKQEFFGFFQKGISGQQAQIPESMKKDQQLIKAIDKHSQNLLKNFKDQEYCEYASKQIKRFKYSEQL